MLGLDYRVGVDQRGAAERRGGEDAHILYLQTFPS